MIRKVVGWGVASLPVVLVLVAAGVTDGWAPVVGGVALAAASIGCIWLGIAIAEGP